MSRQPKIVSVLVTRDVTQSAHIVVEVNDDESVLQAANRQVREEDWEFNEGNPHEIYLGDPEGDVETASQEDLEMREEFVANLMDRDRQQAIQAAARDMVDGNGLMGALESHGLAVAGTDATRDAIAAKVAEAVANVLRTTEVYKPSRAPAP